MPTPSDYYDPGGQQTSVLPPTYYRPPPPPPKDDNDPTKTQEAAVPRVPPPTPGTPPLPAPSGENINQPTPPTPADVKPTPPAAPTPPLGAWTHDDQVHPGQVPYIRPVPGRAVPDRQPDSWVGSRPVWNPRPGEAGYDIARQPPGSAYTFPQLLGLAHQAGFQGEAAYTAAAIGMAESSGKAGIIHYNDGGKGYNSYGLMQINGVHDVQHELDSLGGSRAAVDPLTSFKAAYIVSKGGADFSPWSTYDHGRGTYRNFLDPNAEPQASRQQIAGPPQAYIPPQGREPHQWGETPEHDWTPGRMPTQHDIPSIMGGLLPLALTLFAGAALGGGLGMVAAFSGYQNARNKGQLEAAKEQRTLFQDRLKETEAGLKEELLEASGLFAQYGSDFSSPGARAAWDALQAKYGDTQLRAALEGGGAAVEQLFKKRDEAFQTISHTGAATTKAEDQAEAARQQRSDEAAMGFPGGGGGGGGAPAGPEKPWEGLGGGGGRGGGPPGPPPPTEAPSGPAGAQPGGEPPPAVPAAAPSEQPPPAPEPGESPPLPDVNVTAPEPAPAAPTATPASAGVPRTPFDAMVSDVVNGEEIEKLKPVLSPQGLRDVQAAAADKQNRILAVRPGPHAAAELKAIDPTFGYYAEGVSNYTMPDPTQRSANRGYLANLFAAAQKINKDWDYKDYSTKQEFRTSFNPDKDVGKTLSRTARLYNLTEELADDAKNLPNTNVASFNNLIAWFQGKEVGDPRYTKFIADWRLFANDAQAVASGKGVPPVTLTSHLIDTLQMGATPQMIRQGIKEDLRAALSSVDPNIAGWHQQFPGQANPAMFDQGIYAQLNQYAHMNIDTGAVPEALPDVGYAQQWGGQTHYYLGGDITNKLNWSTQKPPEAR